ncbi:hypothetical protein [Proteus vulgaris]|uniref:Zinc ABC transporter substrate-binding protein n=1 Tax=Proteus vulgaris TaxID=585 RepID=A0A6G6SHJ1_PROVU|nr:hypothetical protein [Proteus vulgaris]QIF93140.1 hypothetical protein GTH24_04155 [Proteus vulgaris]
MKRIEIYSEMLWWALSHIRNVQTHSFIRKGKNKSCGFEAELLHNVVGTLPTEGMNDNDIYFLNVQAKYYLDNANEKICDNYNVHKKNIKRLFEIVPEHLKDQLKWDGPE